ncbi:hypothetical protein AGABI1DRAFT_113450 [Agaricus bisporus var. burnettii JB137-S8]|uniref:Cytochrome b5 heme-binding domain-containing protein n=1 Tax=Agaricus bisporus var. burnettii (strain JB137-S8 / ATCC MYA-4627 / FGSC 10392) TaxID=597362 RepID=K5XY45_AGABU|nr:hypothetical protein AGABI2DRAFT_191901 [Agaricus bisporus var. bisporus H97]XP_007329447.1 uncharacterized protein AGABI1DRAFT_113450 [Agaricus bisporus var. burnettii JB137-S8]EKM80250.1 hypothetical protein AGABI1DRAFT_113450 [Agaricus bisporus var. burnettii JB137-S8]EKV48271.1 hypothetical protein AGABI2DRAFT_191901 [Agaricus bisporus var. bisporus H97]
MSWLKEMAGGEKMPPYVENDSSSPKVKDPYIPNRMVSNKPANRPFLAYRDYREKQEALHAEWLKKKEEHDEKVARGEKVEPLEPDPTAVHEVGVLGLLKFILYLVLIIALAGKFITGSFVWEYESQWLQLRTYMPKSDRLFSERMLAQYDGSDPNKPIYLAIGGVVYDVTKSSAYRPGGSYHVFAGADASRAFATTCLDQDHATHDLRGLSAAELESMQNWKVFYRDHKDYFRVGRVTHKPVDPSTPIPPHCKAKKEEEKKRQQRADAEKAASEQDRGEHDEL